MELWIRSQDKKDLIKITNICMTKEEYDEIGIFANGCIVGLYKSKERALEILDEIQSILCFKRLESYFGEGIINIENNTALYLMPKE